jgi:hypothetical protein
MNPILAAALGVAVGALVIFSPVLWHFLRYQHLLRENDEVGYLRICQPRSRKRYVPANRVKVLFKPAIEDASWRRIPVCSVDDILDSDDAAVALAFIETHRDCP